MPIDQAKLDKLKKLSSKTTKVGGTRRKQTKKVGSTVPVNNEPKLFNQLNKLDTVVTIDDVEEANLFKEDGNVMNFSKIGNFKYVPNYNVSVISGIPKEKKLDDMFQDVLPQLGPEAYHALSQLDEKIKEFEEKEKNKE